MESKRDLYTRRRAWLFGFRAETLAALWLRLSGYRVVARRWRTPAGEIDLLALRRGLVVVVEVKARPSIAAGLQALSPRQQARLNRAGAWALGRPEVRPAGDAPDLRFDVVVIRPWRLPAHITDAWRPEGPKF